MSPLLRFVVALLAGAVVALGFAPVDLWVLAVLGTAVLVALVDTAATRGAAAAVGWAWGTGVCVASLGWIATAFTYQAAMPVEMGWVTVVGLSMFLALYPMLAALLARGVAGGASGAGVARLVVLAGAFMVTEWLRGVLFSGFAWNPLGAAWLGGGVLGTPGVAQLAQFVGSQGLTGLMILAGGAVYLLVGRGFRKRERRVGAGLGVALVAGGIVGSGLVQDVYFPDNPTLVIVQPNIGQDVKYDEGANARHLETYLAMTRDALAGAVEAPGGGGGAGRAASATADPLTGIDRGVPAEDPNMQAGSLSERLARADLGERPRIVVWSESAVFGLPEEEPGLRAKLAGVLGPRDLLIFGGVSANRDAAGRILTLGNSLFVLDARGVIRARYDKAHLTPLGEYLPLRPLMERLGLARLAPGGIDFVPGPGPRTIALPGLPPVGAMICYEIIFGGRVTEFGQRPAWIVNISNDAWFGRTGPPQHLAQARLRAIEEGLPIARATPTGVSAIIGPRGRVFASLPQGVAGTLVLTLPPPLPATLYAKLGDAVPLVLAGLMVLAGVLIGRRQRVSII